MKSQSFLIMPKVPAVTIFAVLLVGCSTVTALEANGPKDRIGKVPEIGTESTVAVPVVPVLAADAEPLFTRAVEPGEFSIKSIDEQEFSSSIKENLRERVRLMREHKAIQVSDHEIPEDFAAAEADYARKTPLSQLISEGTINFSPANVDATSLRGQAMVGAIPCGVYVKSSWTGLDRMFHHPALGYVVLEENDLTKTGGETVFTKEMINADVNGAPGVLVSKQGSEKKSVSSLTWFSNGVLYLLRTPRVDDKSRDELLNIARGISK
jgi:hypothetical protein